VPRLNEESKEVVRKYLQRMAKRATGKDFESFAPNPVLGVILTDGFGFEADRAFRIMIEQHFERSLVTSVGNMFQAIAKTLTARATGVEGADVQVTENGLTYFIQIKSGPRTMNKDIAANTARKLASAVKRHGKAIGVLGVCYGREDQLWSWPEQYQLQVKIADEFWAFISDGVVTLNDVISLVSEVARETFRDITEAVDANILNLLDQFHARYAPGGTLDWKR